MAAIWILLAVCGFADTYVRQPSIDIMHYDISIEFTDTSDSITASVKIDVRIIDAGTARMWLDFGEMSIDRLLAGGKERPFQHTNGRLAFDFDSTSSPNEIVQVEVQYHGKPKDGLRIGKNRYGRRVIFADNWPDSAHDWFPSIDHPSDKATVTFTVTAPANYEIVANGTMTKTLSLQDGRRSTQWKESREIPTYCMVVGMAEFVVVRDGATAAVPLSSYAYPEDAAAAAEKFSRTARMVSFFEGLAGPYPYEKLAQVESDIEVGAMENSDTIFYSESYFAGTPVSEKPVAHEIAHQWFGDSVTEADWDHLWLSEGFATYLEALFYENRNGPAELKAMMADYAKKISGYKPALTVPIIDPEQKNPRKKLGPVNYEKGAWVLHMLRGLTGDKLFFEGIRRYYGMYAGRNVTSDDFQKAMESVSGISLDNFFEQWLYRPGWPEYAVAWRWDRSAREVEITIKQRQTTVLFDMPVDIAVVFKNRREIRRVRVADPETRFRIPAPTKPSAVELDPDGWVLKTVFHAPAESPPGPAARPRP